MIRTKDHEERTATARCEDKQEVSRRNITAMALKIVTQGARANPEGENTVAVAESGGETTVYRIFRQRHLDGDPLAKANRWIRKVKEHCRDGNVELKAVAVWTDTDGGSVLVAITGQRIIAREEDGQVI